MNPTRKTFLAAGAIAALAAFGGVAFATGNDDAEDAAEGQDVALTGSALESASKAALDYLEEGRVTDTEVGDEESYYEVEVVLDDGRQVDVQLDEDFNVVGHEYETEDDEDGAEEEAEDQEINAGRDEDGEDDAEDESEGPDAAITGDALAKASATAVEVVQEEFGQSGTVTESEVGDEESYYEVEVTLDDGRQVDVQLDENFDFVGLD